jgi:hypothetical protein
LFDTNTYVAELVRYIYLNRMRAQLSRNTVLSADTVLARVWNEGTVMQLSMPDPRLAPRRRNRSCAEGDSKRGRMTRRELARLQSFVPSLKGSAGPAQTAVDSKRLQALAQILERQFTRATAAP